MVLPPRRGGRLPYFTALIWGRTKFTFSAASTGNHKACLGVSCPMARTTFYQALLWSNGQNLRPPFPNGYIPGDLRNRRSSPDRHSMRDEGKKKKKRLPKSDSFVCFDYLSCGSCIWGEGGGLFG